MKDIQTRQTELDKFIRSCSSKIDESQELINHYDPEDGIDIETFLMEEIQPLTNLSILDLSDISVIQFDDVLLDLEEVGIFK